MDKPEHMEKKKPDTKKSADSTVLFLASVQNEQIHPDRNYYRLVFLGGCSGGKR